MGHKLFRTAMVHDLRMLNGWLRHLTGRWADVTRIYDRSAPGSIRRARPEELPENRVDRLQELIDQLRTVAEAATLMASAAQERLDQVRAGQPDDGGAQ